MALEENDRPGSRKLDRLLAEEIPEYEPPSDAAVESWLESAPHPVEAVDFDDSESTSESDP